MAYASAELPEGLNKALAYHAAPPLNITLPETNMETQKGPVKTTVPLASGYIMGHHVSSGECIWAPAFPSTF